MRPFTVLGYSANDEILCHACLKSTTGLHAGDLDYNGRPILPLYAADATVEEESCTYCGHSLLDMVMNAQARRSKVSPTCPVEKARHHGHPALKFDRRPPPNILRELKDSGWRWDPVARLWWLQKGIPVAVPPSLGLPPPPPNVSARPPIVRKRTALSCGLQTNGEHG